MPSRLARSSSTKRKRGSFCRMREARLLEVDVVVVVEVVEADDLVAAREQPSCRRRADEAGGSRDQNLHRSRLDPQSRASTWSAGSRLLMS